MADAPGAEEHIIDVRPDKACLELRLANAATRGDWKTVEALFKEHPEEITPSTILGYMKETALHIATRKGRLEFVEKLVEMMDTEDLCVPDLTGNTALGIAARLGRTEIASILLTKKLDLAVTLVVRRWFGGNYLPIQIAAMSGQSRMVSHLYEVTKNQMEERDHIDLFLSLIEYGSYDVVKKMLSENPGLATIPNNKGQTALHAIAGQVSNTRRAFVHEQSGPLQLERFNELIQELLEQANGRADLIKGAIYRAAREGNCEFLSIALRLYPEVAIELDDNNHTIFHVAVQHRRVDVFNMMQSLGPIQSCIRQITDSEGNNILHLAAKLPCTGLKVVAGPGAVLQLQREFLMFKEVLKVHRIQLGDPRIIENCVLLFEKEHEELRCKAEKWLTNTLNPCMSVAVLIFGAGIAGLSSVPGGYKQDTGVPIHLGNVWFTTYRISYAATSLFSLSSMIIFLSILISGFPTRDFLKSLPSKLLFGILSLVVSIVAVVMTGVAALCLHFKQPTPHSDYPVAGVAFVPIFLAACFLLRLPVQLFYSTFMPVQLRRNMF